jgi:hypothetical protein
MTNILPARTNAHTQGVNSSRDGGHCYFEQNKPLMSGVSGTAEPEPGSGSLFAKTAARSRRGTGTGAGGDLMSELSCELAPADRGFRGVPAGSVGHRETGSPGAGVRG